MPTAAAPAIATPMPFTDFATSANTLPVLLTAFACNVMFVLAISAKPLLKFLEARHQVSLSPALLVHCHRVRHVRKAEAAKDLGARRNLSAHEAADDLD